MTEGLHGADKSLRTTSRRYPSWMRTSSGVLARVAGLFSAAAGSTSTASRWPRRWTRRLSRMTIVTRGDDQIIEQITKQLNKLINIIKVTDFTGEDVVQRETGARAALHAPARKSRRVARHRRHLPVQGRRCQPPLLHPRSHGGPEQDRGAPRIVGRSACGDRTHRDHCHGQGLKK